MTEATTVIVMTARVAGFAASALLVALSLVGAQSPETAPIRTIDVTLSRFAFAPERIEVRLGERVRLNVVSADVLHGFRVKALGVNARIPAGGKPVAIELTPKKAGTFTIDCSEYCGRGHSRMKAALVVTPGTSTSTRRE
jgi:cytochrome c oxidase subunit 2